MSDYLFASIIAAWLVVQMLFANNEAINTSVMSAFA